MQENMTFNENIESIRKGEMDNIFDIDESV